VTFVDENLYVSRMHISDRLYSVIYGWQPDRWKSACGTSWNVYGYKLYWYIFFNG